MRAYIRAEQEVLALRARAIGEALAERAFKGNKTAIARAMLDSDYSEYATSKRSMVLGWLACDRITRPELRAPKESHPHTERLLDPRQP